MGSAVLLLVEKRSTPIGQLGSCYWVELDATNETVKMHFPRQIAQKSISWKFSLFWSIYDQLK